ncbi:cation transporter dimerization domain-containing protein [Bacillus gobiensis]|uniref:cation transporter dimerization domain-containing protein n=1 Tax=Bacillus gobiensis TaxID=1441095 RepID=UPI003D1CEE84
MDIYGVKGVRKIKERYYGCIAVVDVVILVNSSLDIKDGHEISPKVENALIKKHDGYDVHVHVEPNKNVNLNLDIFTIHKRYQGFFVCIFLTLHVI